MLTFAIAVAMIAQPAAAAGADPAKAEIAGFERQWGEAFVKRDFEAIEALVAPEFRLVGADDDGSHGITLRDEWMKNARVFVHHGFTVETVDVNRVGDTAVASAKGLWTVSFRPGAPAMPIRFFVTDTWVKRGGKWQVVHRYSHRLNGPAPTPAAAGQSGEQN